MDMDMGMEPTFYLAQSATVTLLSAHAVIAVSGFLTNWFVTRYVERRKDAMKLFRRLALVQFKASCPNILSNQFLITGIGKSRANYVVHGRCRDRRPDLDFESKYFNFMFEKG